MKQSPWMMGIVGGVMNTALAIWTTFGLWHLFADMDTESLVVAAGVLAITRNATKKTPGTCA